MQPSRSLDMRIMLAIHPFDRLQKEVIRASEPLLVNNGMIADAGYGLDLFSATEQFSHAFAVAKYFIFCAYCKVVQAPVKFKLFVMAVQLFKATERASVSAIFSFNASWEQFGNVLT